MGSLYPISIHRDSVRLITPDGAKGPRKNKTIADGIGLIDVDAFTTLVVRTDNSVYRITILRPHAELSPRTFCTFPRELSSPRGRNISRRLPPRPPDGVERSEQTADDSSA